MNKMNPKIIIILIIIFFIVILFSSTFYTVDKDEQAVITRFGKYVRIEHPGGPYLLIPKIEKAYKIPTNKILKEEFGFRTIKVENAKTEFERTPKDLKDALMVTADLKIIQIEWIVQYKISDPVKYLFKVRDQRHALRRLSKIAMNRVAGDYFFDEIITIAKNEITMKMHEILQSLIDSMELGIVVTTVALINVTPPSQVEAAYNEVLQSQQEKDKIINEAKTEYIKKVTPAEGEALRIISEAKGYYAERVKIAEGEALYFEQMFKEYIKAPEITKKRIYLETISDILPKFNNVYIIDDKQKNLLPFLPLDKSNNKGE